MTDHSGEVSDPDCLGAIYGAEEPVYAGSGWTALRDQIAREPGEDNEHWVEQTAVLYPSAEKAQKFFDESKSSWQRCAGYSVSVDDEAAAFLRKTCKRIPFRRLDRIGREIGTREIHGSNTCVMVTVMLSDLPCASTRTKPGRPPRWDMSTTAVTESSVRERLATKNVSARPISPRAFASRPASVSTRAGT